MRVNALLTILKNTYEYLYYRLYKYAIKTEKSWGGAAMPEWIAYLSVTFLIVMNLLSLLLIGESLSGLKTEMTDLKIFLTSGLIGLANYIFFIRNKRYEVIEAKFVNESVRKARAHSLLVWIFIVFTLSLILFITPFLLSGNSHP